MCCCSGLDVLPQWSGCVATVVQLPSEGSVLSLLKIPVICVVGLCLFCGAASISFFDVTLAAFLTTKVAARGPNSFSSSS